MWYENGEFPSHLPFRINFWQFCTSTPAGMVKIAGLATPLQFRTCQPWQSSWPHILLKYRSMPRPHPGIYSKMKSTRNDLQAIICLQSFYGDDDKPTLNRFFNSVSRSSALYRKFHDRVVLYNIHISSCDSQYGAEYVKVSVKLRNAACDISRLQRK